MTLKEEFAEYIKTFTREVKVYGAGTEHERESVSYWSPDRLGWYHTGSMSFDDFNKEIYPPGYDEDFPTGCVGIRVDDDFWVEAVLPYKFKDLTIQDLCDVLWNNDECNIPFDEFIFKPDVFGNRGELDD